jgi:site-specific DNA-cytosine methylase
MKALVGCAGLGLVDIALHGFGFEVVGIEIDDRIASIARMNGLNTITANLLDIDPRDYIGIDLFHISPPCPKFSLARNSKAKQSATDAIMDLARHQSEVNGEGELDIALGRKTIEIIRVTKPEFVTIENVWGYRKSLSWAIIAYGLEQLGYGWDAWNLNAADYGVPQTRRRMITVARRDGRKPGKPFPTHSKKPDMFTKPWVGWHETVEDLIPTLPLSRLKEGKPCPHDPHGKTCRESEFCHGHFAPWQVDRLPQETCQSLLVMTGNTNRAEGAIVGRGVMGARAVVIDVKNTGRDLTTREKGEPFWTVMESAMRRPCHAPMAIVFDGGNTSTFTHRDGNSPIFTVTESLDKNNKPRLVHRAFVANGTPNDNGKSLTLCDGENPIFTITENQNNSGSNKRPIRGYANGRVVKLLPRCLARFQTIPDWYKLRDSLGIGNGLPVKLYEAVLGTLF